MDGDFYGLDDLMTEDWTVVRALADAYGDWITKYGVDGFRLDTAKHVDPYFFGRWLPLVQQTAAAARQAVVHELRRDLVHRRGPAVGDDAGAAAALRPRLPVPEVGEGLRHGQGLGRHPDGAVRRGRLLHVAHHERLRADDVPGQPRHGAHRLLPRQRDAGAGSGAARARPARARPAVPDPGRARRLLRRRGRHDRIRRRHGQEGPAGHVPDAGARVAAGAAHRDAAGRHRLLVRRVDGDRGAAEAAVGAAGEVPGARRGSDDPPVRQGLRVRGEPLSTRRTCASTSWRSTPPTPPPRR